MTTAQPKSAAEWGTDFFGALNQMPAEVVTGLVESLEFARTEPGFHEARRAMLRDLGLAPGRSVLEGGCGTGAALPAVLELVGKTGQVLGVDPTVGVVEAARRRAAELGAATV